MNNLSGKCTPTTFLKTLIQDLSLSDSLIDAILEEDSQAVTKLLDVKKANPNFVIPERGVAPFHVLAGLANEGFSVPLALKILNCSRGDPNVCSEEGLTPVHVAAMWGRCKMLQVLLSNGGDPYLTDYVLFLTSEEYALKERQWNAFDVLTRFEVLKELKYPEGGIRVDDGKGMKKICGIKTNHSKSDDHDLAKIDLKELPLTKDTAQLINNHRKNMEVYEHPNELPEFCTTIQPNIKEVSPNNSVIYSSRNPDVIVPDSNSEISSLNENCSKIAKFHGRNYPEKASYQDKNQALNRLSEKSYRTSRKGPKVPKWNKKHGGKDFNYKSEQYLCGYAETSLEYNRSYSSEAMMWAVPSKNMISKISRIFLFMLNKQHVY